MTSRTKTPKADPSAERAAMRALSTRSLADLRTAFQHTHGKEPGTMKRDALIKSLLAHADAQPPASHPSKEEQKRAKAKRPSTRKRDPRLPDVGAKLTRTYLGKEYVLEVLDRGFKMGGEEFRSSTAAALSILPYRAVSGPAWWGYAKPAEAAAPEQPKAEAPAKKKAGRPISPKRR
jgi:hypothetical protein